MMPKDRLHPPLSFTTTYPGRVRELHSDVQVSTFFDPAKLAQPFKADDLKGLIPDPKPYRALWDTGATRTCITPRVVHECGLQPIGVSEAQTAGGVARQHVYMISIFLPHKVAIPCLTVLGCSALIGADVLLGMDIIGSGDFAVTSKSGNTVLSFRMPSMECIDFLQADQNPSPSRVKPSRNQPCPCGSGKKYKHCCGST